MRINDPKPVGAGSPPVKSSTVTETESTPPQPSASGELPAIPQEDLTAKPITEESKGLRKSEKKASGMIKQARLLGTMPKPDSAEQKEEKPSRDTAPRLDVVAKTPKGESNVPPKRGRSASVMMKQANLMSALPQQAPKEAKSGDAGSDSDWVMVPQKGEDPEQPGTRVHGKINIQEDYDPRAKRPVVKRLKADEFFAKRPPGRSRAMGRTEKDLPEMSLDKRQPVAKAKVGERPTRESTAAETGFIPLMKSLFSDPNAHLKEYFSKAEEPVASTRKGFEQQLGRMDESLAKCEKEIGETVTNERKLIKETMKDSTIMNSAHISSPAHALECKRLGLQPSVAGKVGKFTDVRLEGEMKKLGGGAVNTVYSGKYTLPDNKGSFEGVYKPDLLEWKRGVDDIPMSVYEIGIDVKNPRLAYRNVATTRLDETLGFGLTTRSEMAIHNGTLGTVSERATGLSPQGPEKEINGAMRHTARETNYSDPRLRRDLVRLQFMDHIAGQADRHHGNYFVKQDAKGAYQGLTGIDNDLSWGKDRRSVQQVAKETPSGNPLHLPKYFPPVIDSEGYKSIMSLTPATFGEKMGGLLTSDEISAAGERLRNVQKHLTELKKNGRVLDSLQDWSGDKVGQLLSEVKDQNDYVTYVGRDSAIQELRKKEGLLIPYTPK